MITKKDYITSSGKYPERESSKELTQEVHNNITRLLEAVNSFLKELNVDSVKVSSGFRPSDVNAKIANAAKRSLHTQGLAIDLQDSDGKLDELFIKHPDLMKKYGIFLEHPDDTKSWSHIDISPTRKDRPSRVFKP